MGNPEWPACCVGNRSPVRGFHRAYWQGLSCASNLERLSHRGFNSGGPAAHKEAPPTGHGAKTSTSPAARLAQDGEGRRPGVIAGPWRSRPWIILRDAARAYLGRSPETRASGPQSSMICSDTQRRSTILCALALRSTGCHTTEPLAESPVGMM
jgi:hypothetical protein